MPRKASGCSLVYIEPTLTGRCGHEAFPANMATVPTRRWLTVNMYFGRGDRRHDYAAGGRKIRSDESIAYRGRIDDLLCGIGPSAPRGD